jgi:hypothetical protein
MLPNLRLDEVLGNMGVEFLLIPWRFKEDYRVMVGGTGLEPVTSSV